MNRWILGVSAVAFLTMTATTPAWAGDGLQRSVPAHHNDPGVSLVTREVDERVPMHHFDIRSSVQVSRQDLRAAYVASRDAYTQRLQKYAKCTPTEAKKAVASAHPGMSISEIQLRNIRTNLVYVAITEADEDDYKYFVVVDAGNGKILLDKPVPTHHEKVFSDH